MLRPWEFLETFDLATWSAHAGGVSFESPRALQTIYALAAETRPRAALQLGAYTADGAAVLTAALNAGLIEEIHFVAPEPSDHFRAAVTHARLGRHVHVYSVAPVIVQADLWLIDGGDAHAVERAIDNEPAMIAAMPPGANTWSAKAYLILRNGDLQLALSHTMVDEDTAALAQDLIATEQVWWRQ